MLGFFKKLFKIRNKNNADINKDVESPEKRSCDGRKSEDGSVFIALTPVRLRRIQVLHILQHIQGN